VTFYWKLAQLVISSIMGVTTDEIGPELLNDGVGEIINMISGSAKRYLADTPYYFQLSLPTVILGWQHEIGHPENSTVAVLIFDVEDKSFAVQVSLTPGKK
jgi:chemotaxis protein CheX